MENDRIQPSQQVAIVRADGQEDSAGDADPGGCGMNWITRTVLRLLSVAAAVYAPIARLLTRKS